MKGGKSSIATRPAPYSALKEHCLDAGKDCQCDKGPVNVHKDSLETVGKFERNSFSPWKIGLHCQQNELDVVQLMNLMLTTAKQL